MDVVKRPFIEYEQFNYFTDMRTLKRMTLKETNNDFLSDSEMKLVLGGSLVFTGICRTKCDLGNGNLKEIFIPNATACYVDEGVCVIKAFCSNMQDEICYVHCNDVRG